MKTKTKNCPHQKTDNKGYINCTHADSHIGLCQNPCPYKNYKQKYKYKETTASAAVRYRYIRKVPDGACSVAHSANAAQKQPRSRYTYINIAAEGVV